MPQIARVGDKFEGVCHNHESDRDTVGVIISGSPTSDCDGQPIARIGDQVEGDCGHFGTIVTGSAVADCDGIPMARIGDQVTGDLEGVITTGSPSSDAE